MLEQLMKVALTSVLVVAVSEAAKRSTLLGALLASLPLTSVLAMIWLYADTKDTEKIASLSTGIFWLVLPSLVMFLALPWLLRKGYPFALSMTAAIALSVVSYFAMLEILKRFGIEI